MRLRGDPDSKWEFLVASAIIYLIRTAAIGRFGLPAARSAAGRTPVRMSVRLRVSKSVALVVAGRGSGVFSYLGRSRYDLRKNIYRLYRMYRTHAPASAGPLDYATSAVFGHHGRSRGPYSSASSRLSDVCVVALASNEPKSRSQWTPEKMSPRESLRGRPEFGTWSRTTTHRPAAARLA